MSDASSADCKRFIEDNAAAMGWPQKGLWKRRSKTKSDEGWLRVFEHDTGAEISIVEPFGGGAAGLRVAGAGAAADVPLAKSKDSTEREAASLAFASASDGLQAAMRWVDAMLVIGGKSALYSPDPDHRKAGKAPKTWADFKKEHEDHSGKIDKEWVHDSMQDWVEKGMADPDGRPLLLSRVRWCFTSDADHMEKGSYWNPGDGADIFVWAADAEGEDPGSLPNPVYEMGYDNQMENVWSLGKGGATGKEAMIQAWEELRKDGVPFDMAGQKYYGMDSDYDEKNPLHLKVHKIIPELIAAKEAKALGKVAAPAGPAKRGMSL